MKQKLFCGLAVFALAVLVAVPAQADLTPYSQDFETLDPAPTPPEPGSLGLDGWLAFVNAFLPGGGYAYGYGPFPTPQGGPAFAGVASGQGGVEQGDQQLSVYNDYNNTDHGNGFLIEANVFQEQTVGAGDVGSTWIFSFDTKRGNINENGGSSTALAFIKTLDPDNSFALTNFVTFDTTNLPDTWARYELSIDIDSALVGQIFQFGFANSATLYQASGVLYDNVNFAKKPTGACCGLFDCTEGPVGECVGEYQGDDTTCGDSDCSGPLFLTLCHIPPGNPGNAHTITVSLNAANAHLRHGDTLGACGINPDVSWTVVGTATESGTVDLQQSSSVERQTQAGRSEKLAAKPNARPSR